MRNQRDLLTDYLIHLEKKAVINIPIENRPSVTMRFC